MLVYCQAIYLKMGSNAYAMLAAILVILIIVIWFVKTWYKRRFYPPGPFPLPLIGNLHLLRKDIHLKMDSLANEYGTIFTLWMAHIPYIVITNIDIARKVTVTKKYANRLPLYVGKVLYTRGAKDMIMGDYGPSLVLHRKLITSSLKMFGDGLAALETRILSSVGNLLDTCERMSGLHTYDMGLDIELSAFNVIASIVFGSTVNKTDERFIKIRNAVLLMMQSGVTLSLINFYPILRYLPNKELTEMLQVLNDRDEVLRTTYLDAERKFKPGYVSNYIEALLQTKYDLEQSEGEGYVSNTLSTDHIEMNIFDMFLGGVDTISTTLRWAVMYLIKWPDVQRTCQMQLDKVMGPPCQSNRPAITLAHKKDFPFIYAIMYETLRLASTLPFGVFHKSREDTVLEGYNIAKGTATMINLWTIHHDSNNFKDPFVFRPERFLDADGNLLPHKDTRHFFAFSAGPRQCPGQDLAKTELFLFLSNLLYYFELESSNENESLDLHGNTKVTHAPKPYKVFIKSRT